jgi:PAS domain S-box-containing protein
VIGATLDLERVLRSLMTQLRDYFQAEVARAICVNPETGEQTLRVAVGEAREEADTPPSLAVPIEVEGQAVGVIEVLNPATGAFDEYAERLLLAVADLAAVAIRNVELYERARRAEGRYESLFNASIDPIIVLDLDGKILDLNQRVVEMLGCPREQLSGADLWSALGVPPETCQAAIQRVREGQRFSLETHIPSAEGSRTLETHMAKIDYGGREAIQWIGHDISERVALEQMRADLTQLIVHDLRSPLGSIMSSLQLISTAFIEQDETVPVLKLVRIAMRSGQKLFRLINSLLDMGRLEAGETELKKISVSPEALVSEAIEQIQPLALDRGQTLLVHPCDPLPEVPADNELILRVLTNLLDNAVKFTPKEGTITVRVEQVGQEVQFAVSDTGPGISPEFHQHVFERFGRLDSAHGFKGSGLGLTFCKVAVEAHGGRIWVGSEAGRGATFYFTLPLEAAGGAQPR